MNQGCLKAFAIVLMVAGVLLGLLGVTFIIASKPGPGFIMLVIGVILIAFAASRMKTMQTLSPEGVEQQIMQVAADANGDVTVSSVAGVTGLQDAYVRAGLERLLQKGMVQVERRDGTEHYLFAGLKQEKMVKQCPYCGNEYPVSQAGRTCPSCGGNLDVRPE